jgi:hypothetical protein
LQAARSLAGLLWLGAWHYKIPGSLLKRSQQGHYRELGKENALHRSSLDSQVQGSSLAAVLPFSDLTNNSFHVDIAERQLEIVPNLNALDEPYVEGRSKRLDVLNLNGHARFLLLVTHVFLQSELGHYLRVLHTRSAVPCPTAVGDSPDFAGFCGGAPPIRTAAQGSNCIRQFGVATTTLTLRSVMRSRPSVIGSIARISSWIGGASSVKFTICVKRARVSP